MNEKQSFETPEVEIILLEQVDIITNSYPGPDDPI